MENEKVHKLIRLSLIILVLGALVNFGFGIFGAVRIAKEESCSRAVLDIKPAAINVEVYREPAENLILVNDLRLK